MLWEHILGGQGAYVTVEHFLQRFPKDCNTKKSLQRIDLLHFKLELRGLNYQTPFYAGCILKLPRKLP